MSYQSWKIYFLLVISVTVLTTCDKTTDPSETAKTTSNFSMALLLSGPKDDANWNQSGYEGLKLVEKRLGVKVAYADHLQESEFEDAFRRFAQEDYDFIYGHGGEFTAAAQTVAQAFPRTKFGITAFYRGNNRNLGALSFKNNEAGFLVGVIASLKTKTNKVAMISGVAYPNTKEQANFFAKGAAYVNPEAEISNLWVGEWLNHEKTAQVTGEIIAAGNDVISINVDMSSVAALKEIEAAQLHAITWTTDLSHEAPNAVITTMIQHIPDLVLMGTKLVKSGRWEGKLYRFGLRENVQYFTPFKYLTAKQMAQFKAIEADVLTGKIDLYE